jgi:predicted RNase H-like nuclease (RuvC/YqgF family)
MRGYSKSAVDDAFLDLNRDVLRLSTQNAQLADELRQAKAQIEELSAKLEEVQSPTYAGLGNQFSPQPKIRPQDYWLMRKVKKAGFLEASTKKLNLKRTRQRITTNPWLPRLIEELSA